MIIDHYAKIEKIHGNNKWNNKWQKIVNKPFCYLIPVSMGN